MLNQATSLPEPFVHFNMVIIVQPFPSKPTRVSEKTSTLFGKTLVGLGRKAERGRFSDKSDKAFSNIINILKANDYGKQTIGLHAQRA